MHAAGNRRYLALLHSLSGVVLAQTGRIEDATASLRKAERFATAVQAQDVLAIVCNNQANVALIQHRHDAAIALAERSTALQEKIGPGRGLAISLATLGQILVRLGQLGRPEKVLHRALQMRIPVQSHEITGAVFDTPAQIALMRGGDESAGNYLRQAAEAYGGYGSQTSQWYEWSIRALEAKLAAQRAGTSVDPFLEGLMNANSNRADRKPLTLPSRITWKDSCGSTRFASVMTRDISETGVFIEWRESTSIPMYRLVSF